MRPGGARRIFLYNWPTYAATWGASLVAAAAGLALGPPLRLALGAGAVLATAWSLLSLAVSRHIYDRSELRSGQWARALLPPGAGRWATVDAGLDAEVDLDDALPGRCVARLDVYDAAVVTAPSVRRARARTGRRHAALPALPTALPLPDGSCDVVAVVFTAHELRARALREAFFREVRRALSPGGVLLLVEHLRDLPNFLTFGPGFLHFQGRAEWLRVAAAAGLRVAGERRVTPFVMALALERAA